jgi:hypothetical protein
MHYRPLPLFCKCGQRPFRITQVGLTADHRLLIRWWCAGCNRTVYGTKSLSECWRDCPKPNGAETILGDDCEFDGGEEDAKFLAGFGVKFPESK